ncbi:MAG: hypothetical protein LBS20_10865 [Prevotella sp.]|jgi:hypothetical protein|nr:hypothetical protein [Prevotella sp.]
METKTSTLSLPLTERGIKIMQKFAYLKKCCNFAADYYNILILGKNQKYFCKQDKGKPAKVAREETTVQPHTPSVCCDSHTYGGLVILLNFYSL